MKINEVTNTLSEETIGSFAENIVKTLNKATGLAYDHPRWGETPADVFEIVKQSGTGSRNQKSRGVLIKWAADNAAHQTGKDRREIRQIARKLINNFLAKGKPITVKSQLFGDPDAAYQFGKIIVLDQGEFLEIFTTAKLKKQHNYQTETTTALVNWQRSVKSEKKK